MPAQVLGLEGQNCPHSAGGSKGDIHFVTYIKAWQEPEREEAGRRCKSPRRSGAGPCRNAGSCCHCCLGEELGHTELS